MKTTIASTALVPRLMRKARPTPKRRVSSPCRAAIGHTAGARTMKNSGYACGPALLRNTDWAALNAVYIAQPMTIAKPATCKVRRSSVRRTWRILARRGDAPLSTRSILDLLDAGDPLQRGDPLRDRWMRVEKVREEAAVMLVGVVDHHRGDRVIEPLGRLVVGGDLLQRGDQSRRVARQLDAAHIGQRFAL